MIRRLYVHNFRCLENFDLSLAGQSSWLLIGRNGSGKSTVGVALEVFQNIGRGLNRVDELIKPKDLSRGRREVPVTFEIEVEIESRRLAYRLALELPQGFRQLRVGEEVLTSDGDEIFRRNLAEVKLTRDGREVKWGIDWHSVALPLIQERSSQPLALFKKWLSQMLILRPVPRMIGGESSSETLQPDSSLANLAAWYTGLTALSQAAGATMVNYLRGPMPDLRDIQNRTLGGDARDLELVFANDEGTARVPFQDLSDGEKSQFAGALLLAASELAENVPLVCFWDEPDSHLSLDEVQHFVMSLRRAFRSGSQIVMTSHHSEAIRSFTEECTILLHRRSHSEPVLARRLEDVDRGGDIVGAMLRGDLEP